MVRLDDVIAEVEAQLQALKRQARQASRYRNLSGHIRKAEALVFLLRWQAAEAADADAAEALRQVSMVVAERTQNAAIASTEQAKVAETLPPLREAEAAKTAALQRLMHERDALDAEERRAREEAQRMRQRISQAEGDITRERTLEGDAETTLAALDTERRDLAAAKGLAANELAAAEAASAARAAELAEQETALESLTMGMTRTGAERPKARVTGEAAGKVREALEQAIAAVEGARAQLEAAKAAEATARAPMDAAERDMQRLSAEGQVLAKLLNTGLSRHGAPLVDAIHVEPGYEAALAAALGDSLEASTKDDAPHHWRELMGTIGAGLPDGATPLANFVKAPAALARRLSQTGVVERHAGTPMQAALKPGQRLVSQRGDLWRWDGYCASADAPSQAAVRLEQRNRLHDVEHSLAAVRTDHAKFLDAHNAASAAATSAADALRDAEHAMREREADLMAIQAAAAKAARTAAGEADAALALLKKESVRRDERLAGIGGDIERWTARRDASRQQMEALAARIAEMQGELARLEALPETLTERRNALAEMHRRCRGRAQAGGRRTRRGGNPARRSRQARQGRDATLDRGARRARGRERAPKRQRRGLANSCTHPR